MSKMRILVTALLLMATALTHAQSFNQYDEDGDGQTQRNGNFNPHNTDTTSSKVVPKGIYVWTVDRKFGDIRKAEVDTLPHLYPQSTMATGRYGQYNTIGSNYSARLSRIFNERPVQPDFFFTSVYDQVIRTPDQWHFTNTLSPITNLSYGTCGDKTNGEDLLDARFAANFSKQLGIGLDLNYLYARGYYQNQSTSHFGATGYVSYLGDQYQLHAILSNHHQKAAENGGITNDNYITHPELYTDSYSDNEIPTILNKNWNRNDNLRLFLTHRYAVGFYRKVKMTEEELKAHQFAQQAKKEKEAEKARKEGQQREAATPQGRPDGAIVVGDAPKMAKDSLSADTTRIKINSKQQADSLLAQQALADSIESTMKREFVPVTSFIHTLEWNRYDHKYIAYNTPSNYYANTYYDQMTEGYQGDSIFDRTKQTVLKNTLAIALLEGFNKYVPAGLNVFVTHELRRIQMPQLLSRDTIATMGQWNEHNISIGGKLLRTQGKTLHYNVMAETWIAGEDAGQIKLDAQADLNFPLLGDTVRLEAKGFFYRLNPLFTQRRYHAKHFWWDNSLDKETRTRVEGALTYEKTNTTLRVAIEEIQNYTYLTMDNTFAKEAKTALSAAVKQHGSNLNVLTAQLEQKLHLGPLNWNNILTYQSASNSDVLPLPTLNVFSNLYLQFVISKVLSVELGGSATWFTEYYAPDFCPQLNQFAVQENTDTRMKLGNFPFVDVYANLHLKHARFFVMMTNVTGNEFNRLIFLTPHYPLNNSVLHFGVSWNFFN